MTLNGGVKMKYLRILLVVLLVVIGIGYRTFATDAKSDLKKGIYYDNIEYSDNVIFNSVDGTNLDYNAELNMPGDYYELSFDIMNSTKYDVEITDYTYNQGDKYIGYELTYEDGKEVKNGDVIKKGHSKRLKYKVVYKNYIDEENYTFDTSFYISYEQII